ncbi:sialomucin core protein 24 isoform X2 [Grus americana]|uniref:sialomucin core protein 24 isoform X2 n=1 Tax=Grus americana TaxID=9117 RepID=UPI00240783B0|nr:sialomucin core protein 24 isoform X2 [Grus americana]
MGRILVVPLAALCLACLCGLPAGSAQSRWARAIDSGAATVGICENLSDCNLCIGNDTNVAGCKWIRCERGMCVNETEIGLKYQNCTVEDQCSSPMSKTTPRPSSNATTATTPRPSSNATTATTPRPSSNATTATTPRPSSNATTAAPPPSNATTPAHTTIANITNVTKHAPLPTTAITSATTTSIPGLNCPGKMPCEGGNLSIEV